MPLLLSRYVQENCGTILLHRLSDAAAAERMWSMIMPDALKRSLSTSWNLPEMLLSLPEGVVLWKPYMGTRSDLESGSYLAQPKMVLIPSYETMRDVRETSVPSESLNREDVANEELRR